ncbi:MAG: hypothetical protein WCP73_02575, partial [Eubacteriales bacterium]
PSATLPHAAARKRGAPAAANGGPPAATPPPALRLEEFEARLQASLCLIDVDIPLVALTDGVHSRSFAGNGVVVFQVGAWHQGATRFFHATLPPCLCCRPTWEESGALCDCINMNTLPHAAAVRLVLSRSAGPTWHTHQPPNHHPHQAPKRSPETQGDNIGLVLVDRNTVAIG